MERAGKTSEARLRGEAPQALPVEGALNPNNCPIKLIDLIMTALHLV